MDEKVVLFHNLFHNSTKLHYFVNVRFQFFYCLPFIAYIPLITTTELYGGQSKGWESFMRKSQ